MLKEIKKTMKIKHIIPALAIAVAMTSCTSTKRSPLVYFEDIDSKSEFVVDTKNYSPTIKPDDELYIQVTSQTPSATRMYNLPMGNLARRDDLLGTTTPQQQTYLVNSKGDIDMPTLGVIHVAGLTTQQLKDKLVTEISKEVEDPQVIVQLQNFTVHVAGEVVKPGPQTLTRERYSVLDALSAAGDLTEYAERNNVLLIREEDGKRTAHRLDLNSADLLTSPYFYLRQNDYIYVEPNQIRSDNSKYNQNNAYKLSVISTIVSGASVVASLIIALAIK